MVSHKTGIKLLAKAKICQGLNGGMIHSQVLAVVVRPQVLAGFLEISVPSHVTLSKGQFMTW